MRVCTVCRSGSGRRISPGFRRGEGRECPLASSEYSIVSKSKYPTVILLQDFPRSALSRISYHGVDHQHRYVRTNPGGMLSWRSWTCSWTDSQSGRDPRNLSTLPNSTSTVNLHRIFASLFLYHCFIERMHTFSARS